VVPGFYSSAILYEPEMMESRVPAIINVNGHTEVGKSAEFKQKRCINQARQGILALNLEWMGYGELYRRDGMPDGGENSHWMAGHLDLVGANGVGLFYLAARRILDYLYDHPKVDRRRIGITGLSGGGWQTILLGALDERISAAASVAGYGALINRIERPMEIGDIEQNATDLQAAQEYTHLTAMMAPRPTLLIHNAEDNCCFRAPLVKPEIYDRIQPFFRLYDSEDRFVWYQNADPGDHNYQLENRLQSYRFFIRYFDLALADRESPADTEIKSFEELTVGLPGNNLTILGLARKLASQIVRTPDAPDDARRGPWLKRRTDLLKRTVRFQAVDLQRAVMLDNSYGKGLETRSYRLEFSNGLTASVVWFKALSAPPSPPVSIVLNDNGIKSSSAEVSDRINRGEQVLAVDLVFTGNASPKGPAKYIPGPSGHTQLVASVGERPLGLESAQLIRTARWAEANLGAPSVRIEAWGMRNQVTSLVAAALEPSLFSEVVVRSGVASLQYLLDAPVDIDQLAELSKPTKWIYR
jgi:dienelactone hydrolase